ncbi:MAG: flagellar basal body protein [Balneolales bacterium]|nr:flagellar basal body protein [Balneolales bacterium]
MNLIESSHSELLGRAMDAYSLRQKITATNIANADTPGYKRHEVHFEEALREAEANGGTASMKNTNPSIIETDQNVILENELIEQADTQYRFQLVTRALRHHFDIVRGGITGSNRY